MFVGVVGQHQEDQLFALGQPERAERREERLHTQAENRRGTPCAVASFMAGAKLRIGRVPPDGFMSQAAAGAFNTSAAVLCQHTSSAPRGPSSALALAKMRHAAISGASGVLGPTAHGSASDQACVSADLDYSSPQSGSAIPWRNGAPSGGFQINSVGAPAASRE